MGCREKLTKGIDPEKKHQNPSRNNWKIEVDCQEAEEYLLCSLVIKKQDDCTRFFWCK